MSTPALEQLTEEPFGLTLRDLAQGVVRIPLNHGKVAVIDEADYALISQHEWRAQKGTAGNVWYAFSRRSLKVGPRKYKHIPMHRLLMGFPDVEIDHIDGNGLNNRRSNLRLAPGSKNRLNAARPKNNTSGYKGVYFDKKRGKWAAAIKSEGRSRYLGGYGTPEEAARAYDAAAAKLFGEFARLNFPDQPTGEMFQKRPSTSRYRGVNFHSETRKWVASIVVRGERKHLGLYATEEEAARAYNSAVLEMGAEPDRINIIRRKS